MSYHVTIRDTTTGETRISREFKEDWDPDKSHWWWTEGNYGCDCNRQLEFIRAEGREPTVEEWNTACNDSQNRFVVRHAILKDGSTVLIDR